MSDADAREVIAHMLYRFDLKWFRVNDSTYEGDADAILAALADAGYAVVRQEDDDEEPPGYDPEGKTYFLKMISGKTHARWGMPDTE